MIRHQPPAPIATPSRKQAARGGFASLAAHAMGQPGESEPEFTPKDGNAPADPAYYRTVNIQVAGRSNLYVSDGSIPWNETTNPLYYFGEQMDDTPILSREFFHDVPGDSHGGPQGPPIERQNLGQVRQVTFTLSSWSHQIRGVVEQMGDCYAGAGVIADFEIGNLLLSNHALRFLVIPIKDTPMNANPADKSEDFFTFNFPTCLVSSPIEVSQGTKFSALRFTVEAHRAPPSHENRGVIWNRDITGYSQAVTAQEQAIADQLARYEATRPDTK